MRWVTGFASPLRVFWKSSAPSTRASRMVTSETFAGWRASSPSVHTRMRIGFVGAADEDAVVDPLIHRDGGELVVRGIVRERVLMPDDGIHQIRCRSCR